MTLAFLNTNPFLLRRFCGRIALKFSHEQCPEPEIEVMEPMARQMPVPGSTSTFNFLLYLPLPASDQIGLNLSKSDHLFTHMHSSHCHHSRVCPCIRSRFTIHEASFPQAAALGQWPSAGLRICTILHHFAPFPGLFRPPNLPASTASQAFLHAGSSTGWFTGSCGRSRRTCGTGLK